MVASGVRQDGESVPLESDFRSRLKTSDGDDVVALLREIREELSAIRRGLEMALDTELNDAGTSPGRS